MSAKNLEPASPIRDDDHWIPARDACQMMGKIGRTKFYRLISRGEIDARLDGGKTVVSLTSIRQRMAGLPKAAQRAA